MQSTQGANALALHTEPELPPNVPTYEALRRFRVKPSDVGVGGLVDAGTVLDWIYRTGHAAAVQWSGRRCVTASVGNFHLDRPIRNRDVVDVCATVVYTGRTSMHVLIAIACGDQTLSEATQTSQCAMVFVAIDDGGCPVEVPVWSPVTMLELQRHRQARLRIRTRTRIEAAMAEESYSANNAAPGVLLRLVAADFEGGRGGRIGAGQIVRWMDNAAYLCGTDWAGAEVATSYVAGMRFCRLVTAGDDIEVTARVIHTGPRSIHCGIRVTATDGNQQHLVAHSVVVVVSLGEHGEAQRVPRWEPASDEDCRLDRHALQLIELRQYIEPFPAAVALPR